MTEAVLVPEVTERIDLLDRQEFVDQILTIVKALSDNRKNTCFAINGRWGSGKSFVLDMFEEQAQEIGQEGQELSRYLIFRYNCWEYDYYEEPLVAIVASILDQIDEKEKLISADSITKIRAVLREVGKGLTKKAVEFVDAKTGINLESVAEIAIKGMENVKSAEKEAHEYDHYYDFKKNLVKLQKGFAALAEDQTIIIIVDELDRCLPEYTIKVLERLHHLFDGVPNIQVILAIDMGQLEHVVTRIFGEQTDAGQYLRKFIGFELKLDTGTVKDNFDKKFRKYTKRFEPKSSTTSAIEVEKFKSNILNGIDMRRRISIIDRCEMLHSMLQKEEVVDSSYLCLEMLLVILNDCDIDLDSAKRHFSIGQVFESDRIGAKKEIPGGLTYLSNLFQSNRDPQGRHKIFTPDYGGSEIIATCLLGKLLIAYRYVIGFRDDNWINTIDDLVSFVEYGKVFWDLLQIVC